VRLSLPLPGYTLAAPPAGGRMPEASRSQSDVRFGAYRVDLHTGELRKHGQKVRLAGRPFQILAMLLEQPGELLTRKELQSKLWPADTFVDFEHGVNAAVQTLRRALCDSHKKPRYIETLPRRGYRFIAEVESARLAPVRPKAPDKIRAQPAPEWVGQVATICDASGRNYVLLPISEELLAEMQASEAAQDDLGISLLVADEKLLLISCGTKVKILEVGDRDKGCSVRILGGHFVGVKAFAPRAYLSGLS
jgi:DNA-binding winged helix-turn-helix (wHTH) protein